MDADEIAPSGELGRLAFDLRESPLAWFRGYAGDPEKSAEKFSPDERWYLAGDVARADGDGNFYFASRDDDVIIMAGYRSEEHTSELQSLMRISYAVFCLKKKNRRQNTHTSLQPLTGTNITYNKSVKHS